MSWIEIAGWAGAVFTASAYSMRNMRLLRIFGVAANLSFITYGVTAQVWPMLGLHLFLLPMNLFRLAEIFRVTRRLRHPPEEELNPLAALKPFLKPVDLEEGSILFRRGEVPDRLFVIDSGEVRLPERNITLGPGELFGEMAYFSAGGRRTTSAIAKTPLRVFAVEERDFMQVFNQNPEFGFYIIRLISRRLVEGASQRPALYGDFADLPDSTTT